MTDVLVEPRPVGLGRHAARMTVAGMFQRVTGAVGGVIAAHLLGPAGRGVYAIIVLVGAGAALLATCGLQFWVARRLAVDAADPGVRRVLIRHARFVVGGLGLVAVVAVVVVPHDLRATVLVTALLAVANAGSLLLIAIPTGQRRTNVTAGALAAGGVAWLLWLGAAIVLGWRSPALVALGAATSHVAICAVCARFSHRLGAGPVAAIAGEHGRAVRGHLAPGMGEVVLLSAFRVDVALVAILASPAAAGLYAVATSLAELMWLVPDAIATVLLPHLADRPEAAVGRAMRATLAGMAVVGLPLLVAPGPLIATVFGEPFRGAAQALPGLVVAAVFLGVWKVESAALVARGAGMVRLVSALAALGVLVAGDLVLVPAHGPRGAAWSCAAGYAVAACITRASSARTAAAARPAVRMAV